MARSSKAPLLILGGVGAAGLLAWALTPKGTAGSIARKIKTKAKQIVSSAYPGQLWDQIKTLALPTVQRGRKDPTGTVSTLKSKDGLLSFSFDGGWVLQSPYDLLAAVEQKLGRKVGITAFTLATAITSEAGSQPRAAREGIGWTIMNSSARSKIHPVYKMTPKGWLGRQGSKWNNYVATSKPTNAADIEIAEGILSGKIKDPTGGAINFDSPKAQRAAAARGTAGYTKSPEEVAAERMKSGLVMVTVPGVSADDQRFWRPRVA